MKVDAIALTNMEASRDYRYATLRFERLGSKSLEVRLPFEALSQIAPELLRRCLAAEQRKTSPEAASRGYAQTTCSLVDNVDVLVDATCSCVIVLFDAGTDREMAYVIPSDGARRIGERLLARSAECMSAGKSN